MKLSRHIFIPGLVLIYLTSWFIEAHGFVAGDISLDLREAAQLLAGGIYGKDFFEVNPPLFLYLFMPSVILAQWLPWQLFTIFHLFCFLLISLSLALCHPCVKRLFPTKTRYTSFFLLLAAVLLLLPMASVFGQREHFMLILTLPYFLLMACRLQHHSLRVYLTLIIGLAAGIGFAMKPFFCISFALLELYFCLQRRSCLAWRRIETLTIGMVILIYLCCIFIFYQTYLTIVLPLALRFYYQGYSAPWQLIWLNPPFICCALPVFLYLLQCREQIRNPLTTVLLLGLLGFSASYVMQRTLWYYHVYPAFALAVILTLLLLRSLMTDWRINHSSLISTSLVAAFLFPFCLFCTQQMSDQTWYQKKTAKLAQFLKQRALGQPVYFLSSTLRLEYPLVDYAGARHASRYPSLWWIYGYLHQIQASPSPALRKQLNQDREHFLNTMAWELNNNKPAFIFVESGKMALYDYVKNFSHNNNFSEAWKNYHDVGELSEEYFYHFKIYQRNA